MKSLLACITIMLIGSLTLIAQTEWKNWNAAQLELSFTKKLDLKFSHLRSYSITNGYALDFTQTTAQLQYDLSKNLDITGGYTMSGSTTLTDGGSRFFSRIGYKARVAKVITWSNSLQGEIHDKNESRYHYRLIWNSRISPRKRLDFLSLSPAISYSLFYNIGGNPIRYYDKTGTVIARQTPDGFHRGRLMLSLNSKITKSFSATLYFMHQQEFNLFTPELRKMNITNPVTGKVTRSFDNYNVAGLNLIYDIKLYRSSKK